MIIPKRSERCVIIGPTGSGKSVLAERLLAHYGEDYVIMDPKRSWKAAPDARIVTQQKHLRKALNDSKRDAKPIVYRPSRSDVTSEGWSALCNEVAAKCLERKHTILYYDELAYVANGSNFVDTAPDYYYAITTGRSSGVGVWGAVQRPAWIPRIALTESDCRYAFYLRTKDDQRTVEGLMGEDVPWQTLRSQRYAFCAADDRELEGPFRLRLTDAQTSV